MPAMAEAACASDLNTSVVVMLFVGSGTETIFLHDSRQRPMAMLAAVVAIELE